MYVWMLSRVEQIVAAYTETGNLACTDLLMNPDRTPKNQASLTYFTGQNRPPENMGVNVNTHFQASWSLTAHGMLVIY